MKKIVLLLSLMIIGLVLFHAKHVEKEKGFRIGVDPYFSSLNVRGLEQWLSAYVNDLLLELSEKEDIELERVHANADSLLEDLGRNYDAVIGSIRPYNFLEEKYCFSSIILATDPVFILPARSPENSLEKMKGLIVGVEKGSSNLLIVQKYPEIFIKQFDSLPELLDAVDRGQIDGALGNQVVVSTYLKDIYNGRLKMTKPLMEEEGLRFILLKNDNKGLSSLLNKGVKSLKKKKLLELQRKWNLHP